MKRYSDLMTEGKLAQEDLPNNVHITDNLWNSGLHDAVAAFRQKSAKGEQVIFKADTFDYSEFGKGLKPNEVLVRVSTPLTKNGSSEHRNIAKVNVKTGKFSVIDYALYAEEEVIKWTRPLKLEFLSIATNSINYFNIW